MYVLYSVVPHGEIKKMTKISQCADFVVLVGELSALIAAAGKGVWGWQIIYYDLHSGFVVVTTTISKDEDSGFTNL